MKDIIVNGETYRWYYTERDNSFWYVPKNNPAQCSDGAINIKAEELKEKHSIEITF